MSSVLEVFPLELGGNTYRTEDIYNALRSAVGVGGAGPKDSIEDLWRQSKAQAIASVVIMIERALRQAFPNVATDHIASYERLLGFGAPAGATDEERRRAITAAWTARLLANMPEVEKSLQVLDPAFYVTELPYDLTALVHFGKMFPERTLDVPASQFPNYADDFVLRVGYTLATGQTAPDPLVLAAAEQLLNTVLPGWTDYEIVTGDGFFTDGGDDGSSLLDLTTLAE
jgi:hypothetical protein